MPDDHADPWLHDNGLEVDLHRTLFAAGVAPEDVWTSLWGASEPMLRLFDRIGRVAPSPASVLITGETGSGKELVGGSNGQWRFETPRGRLTVKAKDENPAWVPPDWHYVEQAHKKGLGIVHLDPGETLPTGDGGVVTTSNGEVVRRYSDGRSVS